MEKHRLSAIMFTDIVGYTAKMEADEVKMLRLLDDHYQIVEGAVANYEGDIVKRIGDAFLVNFDSALNAVLCAIEIQQAHSEYNKDKTEPDQVQVRIGIHLGDIVIREGDVFGDGVNVASRVQPLAEPGGICITRAVYDVVKRKMAIKAVELGPQQLKNVDEAVEVFHLLVGTISSRVMRRSRKRKIKRRKVITFASLGLLTLALLAALWQFGFIRLLVGDKIDILSSEIDVYQNRVVVLPLRNLTEREEDSHLCEGFAQEIIYRLLPVKDIYVYPLDEIYKLKDNRRNFYSIRRSLGANYLVTGSLQREEDSLTVVIELLDTRAGRRLFNARYRMDAEHRNEMQERAANEILSQITGDIARFKLDSAHQTLQLLAASDKGGLKKSIAKSDAISSMDSAIFAARNDSELYTSHHRPKSEVVLKPTAKGDEIEKLRLSIEELRNLIDKNTHDSTAYADTIRSFTNQEFIGFRIPYDYRLIRNLDSQEFQGYGIDDEWLGRIVRNEGANYDFILLKISEEGYYLFAKARILLNAGMIKNGTSQPFLSIKNSQMWGEWKKFDERGNLGMHPVYLTIQQALLLQLIKYGK